MVESMRRVPPDSRREADGDGWPGMCANSVVSAHAYWSRTCRIADGLQLAIAINAVSGQLRRPTMA